MFFHRHATRNCTNNTLSAPYKEEKKPQNHYLLKILGGLVLLLLIIMALTNPNKESHENAIRTEVSKAVEKATTSNGNDIFSSGFGMMAKCLQVIFIDSELDNFSIVIITI